MLRLEGPPVAMAAREHQLAVVWQAAGAASQVDTRNPLPMLTGSQPARSDTMPAQPDHYGRPSCLR